MLVFCTGFSLQGDFVSFAKIRNGEIQQGGIMWKTFDRDKVRFEHDLSKESWWKYAFMWVVANVAAWAFTVIAGAYYVCQRCAEFIHAHSIRHYPKYK